MMKRLCEVDPAAWDHYVSNHPGATPYHLFGWPKLIEATYGHPPYFLAVAENPAGGAAAIRGILPLIHFRSPAAESRLISLPFVDCAGMVADDPEAEEVLLSGALELAAELGAAHLEIRQDHPAGMPTGKPLDEIAPGCAYRAHAFKVGVRRGVPGSAEALWHQLPSKVRNQIRKARRCNGIGKLGGQELLGDFYAVFSHNMRDLGSPVHAPGLFEEIFRRFPDRARIVLVEQEGLPVAAALVFRFGETLYNPWASSLRSLRPLCPNMLLYWEMLSCACQQGVRFFDFGRSSPRASSCAFKRQWGAETRPLVWHLFSLHAQPWVPERESLVIASWKNLDLSVSRKRGPELRRWISL